MSRKSNHSKLFNLNHCSPHMKLETVSISNSISKTISQMEKCPFAIGQTAQGELLASLKSARKSRWSLSYRKTPQWESLLCFLKVSSFICFLMYIEGQTFKQQNRSWERKWMNVNRTSASFFYLLTFSFQPWTNIERGERIESISDIK